MVLIAGGAKLSLLEQSLDIEPFPMAFVDFQYVNKANCEGSGFNVIKRLLSDDHRNSVIKLYVFCSGNRVSPVRKND